MVVNPKKEEVLGMTRGDFNGRPLQQLQCPFYLVSDLPPSMVM
jgi:hypothetical protein